MRSCARSGCSSPAAAILTYDRVAQTAYLYSIDDPSARTPGDLCERHLGRLVLPRAWRLDDRRGDPTNADVAVAGRPGAVPARPEKLRAVPTEPARAARSAVRREPSRRKWAEVEPSLFDAPGAAPETVTPEPVWMPRFGPESELDDVLDAKTPLLRRAFGVR
jgi:hypothetical protein